MRIDNEALMKEVKESSIESFIETLNKLSPIWEKETQPLNALMPVLFLPVLFKEFNFDKGSVIFNIEAPIVLDTEGELKESCYREIYDYIENNPKTICYGILGEDSGGYYIEFENIEECIKVKCVKGEDGLLVEGEREKSLRIPLLSFHPDSSFPN